MPAAPVLVLGGTGFLGQALVARLLHDGHAVRVLVRDRAGRAAALAARGVELVQGDLADPAALAAALHGVRQVCHLARGAGPTWDDYVRNDIEPTRRLAELCCAQGIALHYASSIAIYDGGRAGERITEATPPSPATLRLNVYARAKAANERLLADLHRERGLDVVVFRPGMVIGRGGSPRHPGVGDWPDASTCRPWGGGRWPLPFVLVDDCADAMARALRVPGLAGASFNLVGDARLTGSEYLDALERLTGQPIRRRSLPTWRLFAQSLVKWGLRMRSPAGECPLPSWRYCAAFSRRATYAADRARRELGWAPVSDPRVLVEQGIAAAVAGAGAVE